MDSVALRRLKIMNIYVHSTFLNGYLGEEWHVAQPRGFEQEGDGVNFLRLYNAVYGIGQDLRRGMDMSLRY